jgi:hypothetical protein
MKHKIAMMARLGLVALIGAGISCGQQKTISSADQAKLAALKDLRDTGVITAQEYDTKVQAIQAAAPVVTAKAKSAKISWSKTRTAEITDPVYQMTAYTLEVPADWKYAGVIAREPGCHAGGPAMKYTMQSADGLTALVMLPGVTWRWSGNPQMQKTMELAHCPAVDIESAAKFLVNIAIPNLRPNAKIVAVLPLLPQGQANLKDQLEKAEQQNAAMARQYNAKPQKLTKDGARVRVEYVRDGQPVEELITAVIDCNESTMPALYYVPAYQQRNCSSRSTVIIRAPQGRLDELMALPEFLALNGSLKANSTWQTRLSNDQMAAFQQAQAAQSAQFQQILKNGKDANDRLLANSRAQDAARRAQTDRALANDRNQQAAIDASAHATALHSLDRQDFVNPNTGQTIEASSEYNHQWMSSDGSTLIQTNDHTLDPNGVVYPVSQSWSELVPK